MLPLCLQLGPLDPQDGLFPGWAKPALQRPGGHSARSQLAKKQKGSKNRAKARLKVARIHVRIADRRRDYQHKLSTRIVHENQVVCVESLAVKNMVKNHALAKAISDVGWGEFVRQLEYKSQWYGRTLVKIERFYPSSKTCSACQHVLDSLTLDIREWVCPQCATLHDRDTNAAKNILTGGSRLLPVEGVSDSFGQKLVGQLPAKQETPIREDEKPLALAMGRCHVKALLCSRKKRNMNHPRFLGKS